MIEKVFNILLKNFGHQHWWPGETPFEISIGAILTQNTSWTNVEKAICNLKISQNLDAKKIFTMPDSSLAELIRPAGYFNVKTKRLKNFVSHIVCNYNAEIINMQKKDIVTLRQELLNINGIGPETADSILLYALNKKSFVVDAYTKRIFERIGIVKAGLSYDEVQKIFVINFKKDIQDYNEYHALIVTLGKNICKKKPLCHNCCLKNICKLGLINKG